MTDTSKREQLFNLADAAAETILEMSDEEIMATLEAEGVTAKDAGRAFDSLADSARMKAGKKEFARTKQAMQAERASAKTNRPMSADEARAVIERAARELPDLTQAARNATSGKMGDREAFELLEDLIELGFDPTKSDQS